MNKIMQNEIQKKIKELINKYEEVKTSGKLRSYSEEETKRGFIEPLFEALGWDFTNKREISMEESISSKRVDYGFYLNDRVKFYLEAKPLKADLHKKEYADQAIRYSWNKGATWAVLSDFESTKVFNAQDIKKSLADKLFFEISYSDYLKRFDQLWLLSKESLKSDLIDKEAEKVGKKFQKIPVSVSLYKELQECRNILISELGQWNQPIDADTLDEGVQKLLDRLIFIRVAEDRKIEDSILTPMVRQAREESGGRLYQSMIKKFRELDEIYNSNLFKKHTFEDWEDHSGATEKVMHKLYGKEGYYQYDFKAMPADVLGAVYENYLSHRLSKSKKGITVSKDAIIRKEQGIYYTPDYIVDYIVKNALGPVLDKCHSIRDIKKIKVLDPACGSGSFLIKALETIYDKYKSFGAVQNEEFVKIQILQENIYGVDLDPQAVEITRLNLLINTLTEKGKLPFLNNIKNGNSLTLDWHDEFPEVFKQGGFDVIIGNPPYIKEFVNKSVFDKLHNSPYYQGKMDIWTMFACISIDLLKNNGLFSFIAPNNWVTNAGASIFRNKILKEGEFKTFIDFGDYKVFEQAGIQTMIFVFEKKIPDKNYKVNYIKIIDKDIAEDKLINDILGKKTKIVINPNKLIGKNITFEDPNVSLILEKIQNKKNFELTEKEVGQGIVPAPDKYFLVDDISGYSNKEKNYLKKYYTSSYKYHAGIPNDWLFYISANNFDAKRFNEFPNIKKHFEPFKKQLTEAKIKYGTPDKPYFFLHREREERFFINGEKIVCGVRTKSPGFFYTKDEYYGSRALNLIKTVRINLKYLTGILNSKLSYFWLKNKGKQLGDLLQIDKGPLMEIPICVGDKKQQKQITILVDKMLELNKELQKTNENTEKWDLIKAEVEKMNKKIDAEVYKLYGLTAEEIEIVENSTKS